MEIKNPAFEPDIQEALRDGRLHGSSLQTMRPYFFAVSAQGAVRGSTSACLGVPYSFVVSVYTVNGSTPAG